MNHWETEENLLYVASAEVRFTDSHGGPEYFALQPEKVFYSPKYCELSFFKLVKANKLFVFIAYFNVLLKRNYI